MKKCLIALCAALLIAGSSPAQSYTFDHGPYLQQMTDSAVTFVFTTSQRGIAWIELRDTEGNTTPYYALHNGLRDAYDTLHAVRVDALKPASQYQYRLISKQITDFQPYKVTFGDSIASRWYNFSTPDPKSTRCSFIALSDMHEDAAKLETLLKVADVDHADRIFYVGDMMNFYADPAVPFRAFIDKSVELFASERPFSLVRGNHETRGNRAREYIQFVPKTDGKFYGAYRVGEVMFVILDCGEDKVDSHWAYAGLTDFDTYRTEEAAWFARLIETKAYRTARWHVVMNHFPPVDPRGKDVSDPEHGIADMGAKFLPLYRKASIDLMISGHMHEYSYLNPAEHPEFDFPVVVNSTKTVARVDIDGKQMQLKVMDAEGEVFKEVTINK